MDWETVFHGSRRQISTVIIGGEADFRSRRRISKEERVSLIRRLKEYVNLSYESEATIAADMGVSWDALSGWLRGKSEPTFKSLLKVRQFLEHRPKIMGGIAPVGYVPLSGNNPNGRRGKVSSLTICSQGASSSIRPSAPTHPEKNPRSLCSDGGSCRSERRRCGVLSKRTVALHR
jgi:transcriptional regulator with XRE-family HTH domain